MSRKKRSNGQTDYPAAHRDRRDHRQRPKDQSWEADFLCHQAHQPLGPAPGGCEQSHLCPHDRPQGAG